MPSLTIRVAEQRPHRMTLHQPSSDLERPVGQVDDPVGPLALGLVGREDPSPPFEIDVPSLDSENLLRPATGLPADDQQVPEVLVPDLAEDPGVLLERDDHVPPAGPRLLDVSDG